MDEEKFNDNDINPDDTPAEDEFEEYERIKIDNPFEVKFEKDEVVDSKSDKEIKKEKDQSHPDRKYPDVGIDSIINYDYEKRKQNLFDYDYGKENEEPENEDEKLKKEFNDFLVVRKISGELHGLGKSDYIPDEKIDNSNNTVQITDDPFLEEEDKKSPTVIIHRNENDVITHIEVFCSCGEKTTIQLDYEDDKAPAENMEAGILSTTEQENDNNILTENEDDIDMDFVQFESAKKQRDKTNLKEGQDDPDKKSGEENPANDEEN